MKKETKQYLKILWQSILFWTISMMLFAFFRYYGVNETGAIKGIVQPLNLHLAIPLFAISGCISGIIYANINYFLIKYTSKKLSWGLNLIINISLYFLFIIIIGTFMRDIANTVFDITLDNGLGWWINSQTFRAIILYMSLASVVFSFINIANHKFGKGVFIKMLLGKYRIPKEEKRVFLFLDLKSSTSIAEKLEHFKYSQLIQDCFYDLNEVASKYDAEIYQYVGDEVVISWPFDTGIANNNCIALFFEFTQKLENKKEYYITKYGVTPVFKAGLHGGKLMVAEVGLIKKELAFHGDVINTSSRIQSECVTYNATLLISEELLQYLKMTDTYSSCFLGKVILKGKQHKVNIHSITKTDGFQAF